jgi:glycosyltransferase involved in cell wall biosynthesis
MKIVVWQNMLSHLQSAHIRALSNRPGMEVVIVGLDSMTRDRTQLGWTVPDFGSARVFDSPSEREIAAIVEGSGADCIHMLAGWRGLRNGRKLLRSLKAKHSRIGLLTEGVDLRGWRGATRRVLYLIDRLRFAGPFDFILAMGTQGVEWFSRCGYSPATMFPYAYITEFPAESLCDHISEEYEILFLGQLIHRKGIDILLKALAGIGSASWRLTLVGGGREESAFRKLAARLGIEERTLFLPAMKYGEAMKRLACADLLVLPSRFDGWGAVVNEALMSGVPVICSDLCGAKDLLGSVERGSVFRANSVSGLQEALRLRLSMGKRNAGSTMALREWARCIDGESGADYILKAMAHVYAGAPKPAPLWSAAHDARTVPSA